MLVQTLEKPRFLLSSGKFSTSLKISEKLGQKGRFQSVFESSNLVVLSRKLAEISKNISSRSKIPNFDPF